MTSVSPKIKPVVALEVDNANASKRSWLSRLKLDHFRNYQQADLAIHAGQLVILGDNGAGKTNLLEAVSLLAPGRGMRRAKTEHLAYRASGFETTSGIADNDDVDRLDWLLRRRWKMKMALCKLARAFRHRQNRATGSCVLKA